MAAMEKLGFKSLPQNPSSNSSRFPSTDEAHVLIARASIGRVVSISTCSKICAVSFVVGVVVGFTLKRRLRNWARKMLKGLKDD